MNDLIDAIRAAVADEASQDVRAAGAQACRAILAALEPVTQAPTQPLIDPQQVASLVSTLRGVPVDQLLDLAIARLRAALPAATESQTPPLKFQLIAVAPQTGRKTP